MPAPAKIKIFDRPTPVCIAMAVFFIDYQREFGLDLVETEEILGEEKREE